MKQYTTTTPSGDEREMLERIASRLVVLEERIKEFMTDKPYEVEAMQILKDKEEIEDLKVYIQAYGEQFPRMRKTAEQKADSALEMIEKYEGAVAKNTQKLYDSLMRKVKVASVVPALNPEARATKFKKYREMWKKAEETRHALTGYDPYFDSGLLMGLAEIEYKNRMKAEKGIKPIRKIKRIALTGAIAAMMYLGAGPVINGGETLYQKASEYFSAEPATATEQTIEDRKQKSIEDRIMNELSKHKGFRKKEYKEMQTVAGTVYKMMNDPNYKPDSDKSITDKIRKEAKAVYTTLINYVGN